MDISAEMDSQVMHKNSEHVSMIVFICIFVIITRQTKRIAFSAYLFHSDSIHRKPESQFVNRLESHRSIHEKLKQIDTKMMTMMDLTLNRNHLKTQNIYHSIQQEVPIYRMVRIMLSFGRMFCTVQMIYTGAVQPVSEMISTDQRKMLKLVAAQQNLKIQKLIST